MEALTFLGYVVVTSFGVVGLIGVGWLIDHPSISIPVAIGVLSLAGAFILVCFLWWVWPNKVNE